MGKNKIDRAIREINTLEELALQDDPVRRLHPVSKLLVTLVYTALVVSFDRSDISRLISMSLYPVIMFSAADLDIGMCIRRIRIVLIPVFLVGAANPFFDRETAVYIGSLAVSTGVLSMITLAIKGVFAVTAAYILIATTGIDNICRALRMMHVPGILVTVIMLIYRYITLFLKEAKRMTQAYELRAPGQQGIAYRAWGPLLGRLLLRTFDRAVLVYESMCMRGFDGSFRYEYQRKLKSSDIFYIISWTAAMIFLRCVHVFELVGSILVG